MNYLIRKKRILLIAILSVFHLIGFSQRIEVKGRVVEKGDESEVPVGYVNIALLKSDSTFVTGVSGGPDGQFIIKNIEKGDYLLSITCLGYNSTIIELNNLSRSSDLGNIGITSLAISLAEVTVSASGYINQLDRKIIFPAESQIKKSSDGMDLLRNMQLNGVNIKWSDNSISGTRGGRVDIRINGVQASEKELMGINPKDVIRIEYHDEPSLRYGDAEAVIDYILRRRESGGAVMTNLRKAIQVGFSDNYLNAKLNHRKSEFTFSGRFSYRNFPEDHRTNQEVFNFQDGQSIVRIEEGIPDRRKFQVSDFKLNYSYLEPDRYLFAVSAGYYQWYSPLVNSTSILYTKGDRENAVLMTDHNYTNDRTPALNLYYQRHLKNKQLLILDVVGTYVNSDNRREYREFRGEQLISGINSYIDGKKYSIIGEGIYERAFDQGRLSMGVKHTQSFSQNNYTGNYLFSTDMTQSFTYFYAEWMGRVRKFSYAMGVGGTQTHIEQGESRYNDIRFTPSVRLGYDINNYFQFRYRGDIKVQAPSLGDLNAIDQAIDTLQIRRGNPGLKPVTSYYNRLTFSFNKKPVSVNLELYDHYSVKPIMESTFEENEKFVRMIDNQKAWHNVVPSLYINVSLLNDNLNLYLSGRFNWLQSRGDDYQHTVHNWNINGGLSYIWKNWTPFWEIANRIKYLDGETITYTNQASISGVKYKYKNLSLSAYYWRTMGWQEGRDNLNRYASSYIRVYSPDMKNMVFVSAQWNFEFGRKYNSGQKKIQNSDKDSGVMKTNR